VVVGALNSPEGSAAVDAAAERAEMAGGELLLVAYPAGSGEAEQVAEEVASSVRERGIGVSHHTAQEAGSAAAAILEVAEQQAADLIVLGIRRRSRVGKLVLGSNAQDVLLGTPCAVLAVKPTDE